MLKSNILFQKIKKIIISDDVFWSQPHGMLLLLQSVADKIIIKKADKPQVSVIAELFSELESHFKVTHTSLPEHEMQVTKIALIDRTNFCFKKIYEADTLLDPRYIDKLPISEDDAVDAIELISTKAK